MNGEQGIDVELDAMLTRVGQLAMTDPLVLVSSGLGEGEPDAAQVGRDLLTSLGKLEDLLAAASAAQVRITAQFASVYQVAEDQRRQRLVAAVARSGGDGFEVYRAGKGRIQTPPSVSAQVALARRLSPYQGAAAVSLAQRLTTCLPHTLSALSEGRLSLRRVQILARETSHLEPDVQSQVDAEVATNPQVGCWGDKQVEHRTRAVAYRLDPVGAVERARTAESERHVSVRPVPDTMCRLSAVLPMAAGVRVYASLHQHAQAAHAAGDPRSKGQVMADQLVALTTGTAVNDQPPVELQVVISDTALLASGPGAQDPGQLPGYGPVPAGWVRDLITAHPHDADEPDGTDGQQARVTIRRLYATPGTGQLVAMESTRRLFTGGLRKFLLTRDGTCRTPWCDAPIAEVDHVCEHQHGGPTCERNGQGLCVRCNHTKQHPDWTATATSRDGPHQVTTTTPLGFTYTSTAPPVLPARTPAKADTEDSPSVIEAALQALLETA